jgi:hypothetical protein
MMSGWHRSGAVVLSVYVYDIKITLRRAGNEQELIALLTPAPYVKYRRIHEILKTLYHAVSP